MSSFFADECEPPLEGNCDWLDTLHPTFDLASLTKPLFTNLLIRNLDNSNLPALLAQPVTEIIKNPTTPAGHVVQNALKNSSLTITDFLNHRTGVPAWMWFGKGMWHFAQNHLEAKVHSEGFDKQKLKEKFEETMTHFAVQKIFPQNTTECYSDIGYFLLARIAENMPYGQPTDFWSERLNSANSANGTHFFHASLTPSHTTRAIPAYPYTSLQNQIVPSGAFQKREFGHLHDTNGNILASHGIVSGHAGMFGTVLDVALAIPTLANTQKRLLESSPANTSSRFIFGLDTPSAGTSAAGPLTWPLEKGQQIFGHLGYTGTMFWFLQTPNEALAKFNILLTNRTAQRTTIGSEIAPRIIVVTPMPQNICGQTLRNTDSVQTLYFAQNTPQSALRSISRNDAEEIIVAYARATRRIWNDSCLRQVPNIQALRNTVSTQLWQI